MTTKFKSLAMASALSLSSTNHVAKAVNLKSQWMYDYVRGGYDQMWDDRNDNYWDDDFDLDWDYDSFIDDFDRVERWGSPLKQRSVKKVKKSGSKKKSVSPPPPPPPEPEVIPEPEPVQVEAVPERRPMYLRGEVQQSAIFVDDETDVLDDFLDTESHVQQREFKHGYDPTMDQLEARDFRVTQRTAQTGLSAEEILAL